MAPALSPDLMYQEAGVAALDEGYRPLMAASIPLPSKAPPKNTTLFGRFSLLYSLSTSNPRTRAPFKPQKSNRGTSSWQLKQYAEATLGSGSLRKAVKLPEGEDKDEWLAVNSE